VHQLTEPLQSPERCSVRPEEGSLKERKYKVAVVAGPDTGKTLAIEGSMKVGSHAIAGLPLTDTTVSRYHVELQAGPRACWCATSSRRTHVPWRALACKR